MPDERVTQIRATLKRMRSDAMKCARWADEVHNSNLHLHLMRLLDGIDDTSDANDQVDTRLRLIEAAYDSDTVDTARRERRR